VNARCPFVWQDCLHDSEGVIFAHGSRFGGHALFIKDHKLHYVYNFLGIKPEQKFVSGKLKPGTRSARSLSANARAPMARPMARRRSTSTRRSPLRAT
jgi:hypothetical protein